MFQVRWSGHPPIVISRRKRVVFGETLNKLNYLNRNRNRNLNNYVFHSTIEPNKKYIIITVEQ